jgi:outer membrane protein assembly factor BamB
MVQRVLITLLFATTWGSFAQADDWPQWRGANRDGVLQETGLLQSFLGSELKADWSVTLGPGYSGPTVANGRVYVTDRAPDRNETALERVFCFRADDGELIWDHQYETEYTVGYTAGPRASVTVHQGVAIAVGAMGHLKCFDAATGDLHWEHDLNTEYQVRMPIWGITAAPLVYKDSVIQIAAGAGDACVVAFDLETGRERWRAIDEKAGYSAPILIRQGNQDVVVCWTGESITGLNPATGKVFWSVPMLPRQMPIGVPTPVIQGEHLFVSSFYDGAMLIRLNLDKPEAAKLWHRVGQDERNTDALHCMISTPIIKGDYIYGVDSYGELRCLDLKTGDRIWEDTTAVPKARWATIHTIQHGDREIMFNDQGELIFAKLSPAGFQEVSRAKLIAPTKKQLSRRGGVTWSHPAISDGYIYIRNDKELLRASIKAE